MTPFYRDSESIVNPGVGSSRTLDVNISDGNEEAQENQPASSSRQTQIPPICSSLAVTSCLTSKSPGFARISINLRAPVFYAFSSLTQPCDGSAQPPQLAPARCSLGERWSHRGPRLTLFLAIAEQDRDAARIREVVVSGGNVLFAVAIEVPYDRRIRVRSHAKDSRS